MLEQSFNPCFSGSYIMTPGQNTHRLLDPCFNPCFSGSYIMTVAAIFERLEGGIVSILVLVDLIL